MTYNIDDFKTNTSYATICTLEHNSNRKEVLFISNINYMDILEKLGSEEVNSILSNKIESDWNSTGIRVIAFISYSSSYPILI